MSPQLICKQIAHKFSKHWLFKNFSYDFFPDNLYYLTAPNGAGKTTLLRILAGDLAPLNGEIKLFIEKKQAVTSAFQRFIAFQSPSMEIPEVLKVKEIISFYNELKILSVPTKEFLEKLDFTEYQNHKISELSSGTKQRLLVGLTLFSRKPILIFDEPTANFDTPNAEKIIRLLHQKSTNRIVIVASNLEREKKLLQKYFSVMTEINLSEYL